MKLQACRRCGTEKPLSDFYVKNKETGKRHSVCKACWNLRSKEWTQKNPDRRREIANSYYARNKDERAAYAKEYKKNNRDLINKQQRAWRAANPERNRAYGRAAYARDPELARARARSWREANREAALAIVAAYNRRPDVRARNNAVRKVRGRTDPAFAINHRMATRLRGSLKRTGGKSGTSWTSLVGYTADELKAHLEAQFLPRMSWKNMHLWEIDHIIPLSSFDIQDVADAEFCAAWALSNLRPIWRPVNRRKSDKIEFLI